MLVIMPINGDNELASGIVSAAGIMFIAKKAMLLLKRSNDGLWGFPGGHIEAGETPEVAAVRECQEEMGGCPNDPRELFARRIADGVDYSTFIQRTAEQFAPKLNDEHSDSGWFQIGELPEPLHPGVSIALHKLVGNELDTARLMRAGQLTSPQVYENIWLFDVRITGTGASYREKFDEFTYRPPGFYLTDDFLARCNGLPVILDHPEERATLDTKEFGQRIVGTMFIPYIKGDEVWGIAKLWDADAAELMTKIQLSTSPSVVFKTSTNNTVGIGDGDKLLVEGRPTLVDHLAICEAGVWDKGGKPSGVNSVAAGEESMTERKDGTETERKDSGAVELKSDVNSARKDSGAVERKDGEPMDGGEVQGAIDRKDAGHEVRRDADADPMAKLMSAVDAMCSRMDALEGRLPKPEPKVEPVTDRKDVSPEQIEPKQPPTGNQEPTQPAPEGGNETLMDRKDADEIKRRLDAIEQAAPKELSQQEEGEFADAQARADSVLSAFGKAARRPLRGESLLGYRRALAKSLQTHSAAWKGINLSTLPSDALAVAENSIYNDAAAAARNPSDVPEGVLREIITTDRTNRRISNFVGSPNAWMAQFKTPSRRVGKFNKQGNGAN